MTDREHQSKIETMGWKELSHLWTAIKDCETPGWDPGKAFEYLIVRMFEIDRFKVKYPFSVPLPYNNLSMEQIDGIVFYDSIGILLESKDYSDDSEKKKKNINIEPIAKLRNQLSRRPYLTLGCVFSSGGFTEAVSTLIDYLGNDTILLWRGEEVEYCLEKKRIGEFFKSKLEKRIEYGVHDFNITTLDI